MKILKFLFFTLIFFMITVLLAAVVKGKPGNPLYYQKEKDTSVEGPFELSNSTSRYALTESIVENETTALTIALAKFSAPDVVDYHGKFFSIFTPGVSFFGVPFYLLGKQYGMPQLFTYLSVSLIALLNVLLIMRLARKLGASIYAGLLSGLSFLFATNALAYSQSFTQHHFTVTIILLALLNAFEKRTLISDFLFGALVGASILIDIPNIILLFPVILYILSRHFSVENTMKAVKFSFKPVVISIAFGFTLLFSITLLYNSGTLGSPLRTAQGVGRTHYFRNDLPLRNAADSNLPEQKVEKPLIPLPFNTRAQLNGLYILVLSDERSWWYYSPILFIGLVGIFLLNNDKDKQWFVTVASGIILVNYVIYSMFGDPWGGWAFGARYLIPAASVASAGLAFAFDRFKKNILFAVITLVLFAYSTFINFAGALTTSAIPPKVEAVNLHPKIPYTYAYNFRFIDNNMSSSLMYNLSLHSRISVAEYLYILAGLSVLVYMLLYAGLLFERRK